MRVVAGGGPAEPRSVPAISSLRPLRECKDTMGEPVTCVRVTPNDRRVLVRTLADRIAALDVSFFAATHSFDCAGSMRGAGFGGGPKLRGWSLGSGVWSFGCRV